jgi:hypothetical protein
MRATFIAAFLILTVLPANAREKMAARGVGTGSCALYGQLYKGDPGGTDRVYTSWAQGFMSGWNYSTLPKYRELAAKSVEEQMLHVRLYCDAHPLALFVQAVMDLYVSLPEGIKNSN